MRAYVQNVCRAFFCVCATVCVCVTIFALLNEPLGESQAGCSIPYAAEELLQWC